MGTDGEWFTGPPGARRTYRVRDLTSLPGGRGFVFPAERAEDGAGVALKIIEVDHSSTAARIEACYVALKRHPHPSLIEPLSLFLGPGLFSGESEDPPDSDSDLLYLAYRWINGDTLRSAAPLEPAGAARVATDLASAISHLHRECWLIHRDIHPGNIIIEESGRAVLIDIDAWVEVGHTEAAPASGVLGFLPPEHGHSRWDERSDAWALGMVVAYSLLGHPTGKASVNQVAAELKGVLPRWVNAQRVADLIGQLTHCEPDQRRSDLVGWAAELSEVLNARPIRSIGTRLLVGAGAVLAAAALGGIALGWWLGDNSPNSEQPPAQIADPEADSRPPADSEVLHQSRLSDACEIEVGELAPDIDVGAPAGISGWRDELAAVAPDACGVEYAEVFRQALHQLVEIDDEPHVVLASEFGAVALHPVQFASYQQITGRGSDLTVQLGGYPVEVLEPLPGVESLVRLSNGGLLVGARIDTQAFWMPEPVLRLWESHGGFQGLGLPMTNPYSVAGALQQDFERGFMQLPVISPLPWDALEGNELEVIVDSKEPSELPLSSGILRQPNGTAWWYADDLRHWIPDGGVWNCLGGHDRVVFHDIDGITLALLPMGPPATCEMAE